MDAIDKMIAELDQEAQTKRERLVTLNVIGSVKRWHVTGRKRVGLADFVPSKQKSKPKNIISKP